MNGTSRGRVRPPDRPSPFAGKVLYDAAEGERAYGSRGAPRTRQTREQGLGNVPECGFTGW
jgi:hypothetical protein